MKKQIVAMITCLMVCSAFVFNCFTSNAATGTGTNQMEFYLPCSQPSGDGVGYICLIVEKDGQKYSHLYVCVTDDYGAFDDENYSTNGFCLIDIVDNVFSIETINGSPHSTMMFTLYRIYGVYDNFNLIDSGMIGSENTGENYDWYSVDWGSLGYNIVGFEIGGNMLLDDNYSLSSFKAPIIHWNNDNSTKLLNEMLLYMGRNENYMQTYLPKLNHMDFTLSRIREIMEEMNFSLSDDENAELDNFEENSGVQSDELSTLNQQTHVDKIDVNSASQTVDANLNIQTDANYGVLLSTFTSNDRILTMLLLVASVSLISFVLFGKR